MGRSAETILLSCVYMKPFKRIPEFQDLSGIRFYGALGGLDGIFYSKKDAGRPFYSSYIPTLVPV